MLAYSHCFVWVPHQHSRHHRLLGGWSQSNYITVSPQSADRKRWKQLCKLANQRTAGTESVRLSLLFIHHLVKLKRDTLQFLHMQKMSYCYFPFCFSIGGKLASALCANMFCRVGKNCWRCPSSGNILKKYIKHFNKRNKAMLMSTAQQGDGTSQG